MVLGKLRDALQMLGEEELHPREAMESTDLQ